MSIHFHTLRVREVRRETPDAVSIAFDIPDTLRDSFQFTQGQNIAIRTTIDGQECRRNYSICSAPGETDFRIAVKQIAGGLFSTYANQSLKAGDSLEVMSPAGRFFTPLDPTASRHYVAFAAGSGITPLMSIIKTTLAQEPGSRFTLVYGNRSRQHIMFREALEDLKNRYLHRFQLMHVLSREETDSPIHMGRIDAEKCRIIGSRMVLYGDVYAFFLCGPEAMIETVESCLREAGVDPSRIHTERFHSGASGTASKEGKTGPSATGQAHVRVLHDGLVTSFDLAYDGESILDAALRQGVDLPFACKGGMCCTCRGRLVEGKVDMDRNYALEPEEVEAGFILTCQSHPRTPTVTVDYDVR